MAATGYELRPRSGTESEPTRTYRVEGCADEDDALDWIADNTPDTIYGLDRAGANYREDMEVGTYDANGVQLTTAFDVTVRYGLNGVIMFPIGSGQIDYEFNFRAQPFKAVQSLATIGSHVAIDTESELNPQPPLIGPAPDFGGAINVTQDGGKQVVAGQDLQAPAPTFTIVHYPRNTVITSAYRSAVEAMVGTVNGATYYGKPAGSLMLVGCSGGARDARNWNIRFEFAHIPNRINIPVGDIVVPAKDGFDLLWVYYEDGVDTLARSPVKRPRAAYVERVLYRSLFSGLGLDLSGLT